MSYTLAYTYSYEDFVALVRAKRSLGPIGRLGPAAPYLVVGALYAMTFILMRVWSGDSLADLLEIDTLAALLIGVPVVIVLVWLVNVAFLGLVYRPVFKRFAIANKEIAVTLDDAGAKWTAGGLIGQCSWSSVERSVETDDYVFLFFSKVEGLPLPRRAMKSEREFRALAKYVRDHVNA